MVDWSNFALISTDRFVSATVNMVENARGVTKDYSDPAYDWEGFAMALFKPSVPFINWSEHQYDI